jgi:predicted nucleic acid-binding protein
LTTLVIDASVTLGWYFPDESDPTAEVAREYLATNQAVVPGLWWFEIRNSLLAGERRGRIDATQTAEIIAQLDALPIDFDREPNDSAILALARAHGLTFYDAAYLELALRADARLATLDRQLARAARAAHVPLLGGRNLRVR